jgi:hypothetical protein
MTRHFECPVVGVLTTGAGLIAQALVGAPWPLVALFVFFGALLLYSTVAAAVLAVRAQLVSNWDVPRLDLADATDERTAVADGTGDAPGPAASAGGFRVAAATESAASTAMNAIAAMAYFWPSRRKATGLVGESISLRLITLVNQGQSVLRSGGASLGSRRDGASGSFVTRLEPDDPPALAALTAANGSRR